MVKLLQQNGEVVGISGEALTDYAVLKQADVGVSMSESLSGAAHEACDVLVHDDNFNTVIETIKSSRQVHMNIKSSISTIVSSYVCLALYGMLSLLFGDVFLGSPLFIALLSVVVVQVAAMMYISNTGDMKGNLPPSAFIRKGKIAKSFILKAIIQGVSLLWQLGLVLWGGTRRIQGILLYNLYLRFGYHGLGEPGGKQIPSKNLFQKTKGSFVCNGHIALSDGTPDLCAVFKHCIYVVCLKHPCVFHLLNRRCVISTMD